MPSPHASPDHAGINRLSVPLPCASDALACAVRPPVQMDRLERLKRRLPFKLLVSLIAAFPLLNAWPTAVWAQEAATHKNDARSKAPHRKAAREETAKGETNREHPTSRRSVRGADREAGRPTLPRKRLQEASEATARVNARATTLAPIIRNRRGRPEREVVPAGPLPPAVMLGLARGHIPISSVSALVIRLDDDKRILDYNTAKVMQPASTMKVVTSYAALSMLGANFRWPTSAFVDGTIDNGVLHGNLYIEGTGDPFLVPEQLTDLVNQIRQAGITQIAGNLVLDKGYFDPSTYDLPSFDNNTTSPYNVGPDPLLYAFKSIVINVSPHAGQADIVITPPLSQLRIVNDIRVTQGACHSTQAASPELTNGPDGTLIARFSGALSVRCGDQQSSTALQMNHTSFFAGGFLALWAQAGGTFTGSVSVSAVPVAARRIAVHESLPLPDLLKNMNKVSNNTMARNIYLTIGAVAFKPPATEEGADRIVLRWMRRNHIEADGLVIDNGSGLSRDARISTETMGEILQSAFHSPVAQPLIDSFPTVGVDGTMRHRLMRTGITGHAQVKTGTLGDVRAIAGYVFAKNGHPYLVVSDINDPRSFAGGEAHDALLDWVYNQPDTPDAAGTGASLGTSPPTGTIQLLPPAPPSAGRVTGSFPMRGR